MARASAAQRDPDPSRIDGRTLGDLVRSTDTWSRIILVALALSATALLAAPFIVSADYSAISNTTSESAAQGVHNAWLARSGFVLFGLAAMAVTWRRAGRWGAVGASMHAAFGLLMVAAGAFSVRPWDDTADYSQAEDALHSLAATAMGFAFAFGVLAVLLRRGAEDARRVLDLVAIAASAVLPIGMLVWPGIDGVVQRLMFAIAYAWYGRAALS